MDHDLERRLANVLRAHDLRLGALFGSAARGRMGPASDVDVAIWPMHDMRLSDELDLATELSETCGREVDLLRLDGASTLVRSEVARYGRPLCACNALSWPRFVAEAALEYADFAPLHDHVSRRFLDRLASRAPVGSID